MPKSLLVSNVKPPSELLKDSALRKNLPDDFIAAQNLWSQVVRDIENHLTALEAKGDDTEAFLDEIKGSTDFDLCDAIFKKSCWSWAPSGRIVSFEESDRMGQHFLGAMYTSEGYEWPQHEGLLYRPLLQLSLEAASEVAEVNVGSGLLQLFETPYMLYKNLDLYFLRHIPRKNVSQDQMTPLPCLERKQGYWHEGRGMDALYESYLDCIRVDGFTDKRFSMPYDSCYYIEEFQYNLKLLDIESLKTAILLLDEINERLGRLCKNIDDEYFDMALFGFSEPIQMSCWETPDPLLKIGSCRRVIKDWRKEMELEIGVAGHGQIYLSFDSNGELKHEFYWDT